MSNGLFHEPDSRLFLAKIKTMDNSIIADRSILTIAIEIRRLWNPVNYAAKPYLDAMFSLDSINDNYYEDQGSQIVAYFLVNATSWRGDDARRIKAELNAMLKKHLKRRT